MRCFLDYTRVADTYDRDRYSCYDDLFIDSISKEKLCLLLKPHKGMNLLDVGTGTGRGIIFFADKVNKIVGLDATKAMLDKASEKIKKYGLKNVELLQGNASSTIFEDNNFDVVISLRFIHLFIPWKNQRPFIKEMERVTKKGGTIIVEVNNICLGGILGILRKYFDHDTGYNWPWDIYRWSNGIKVEKVIGTCLPGTKKLFKINKRLARLYSNLGNVFPLNFLSNNLIVKFRKI